MKSLIFAVSAVAALAVPLSALSQSDASPTRAQVRAELEQIEQAGYRPAGEDINYPLDVQAAEARVSTANGMTGYGGVTSGSYGSGTRSQVPPASGEQLKQLHMGGE